MQALSELSPEICKQLQFIFCDIDDTLTTNGKLPAESYSALWRATECGLRIVPVTGRPAGWVDHFARMWPVDAVVGENGGLYFWMSDGKMNWHFLQSEAERLANRQRLNNIGHKILARIPCAAISKDQPYREIDLAIDFAEDVGPLSDDEISTIAEMFQAEGAKAKISSIHVNGWFGEFDKLSTCKQMASALWDIDAETLRHIAIYCGDSPNDEPMFEWFKYSVGVANVRHFLHRLQHLPRFITASEGGLGFAEMVDYIISHRLEQKYYTGS
jgi:hypothetical protein